MNRNWIRWDFFALLIVAIAVAFVYRDQFDAAAIEQWIQNVGAAGPVLFISIYVVATALFLPGSVLTLAGGALFGPVFGTLYNLAGATIGATLAFLVARYLASRYNDELKLKLIITYDPEKINPKLISERVTAWNLNGY